jgi:putative phosphoribosyl transferase
VEALFRDRREAGRVLATKLETHSGSRDLVVLAVPRGGVPVAFEVARALGAPLDVFVVRKLGVPGQEELAMGAIAGEGVGLVDQATVDALGITGAELDAVIRKEQQELRRREQLYRGGKPALSVTDRVAILVDDGLATGSTMQVAVRALRARRPARIIVGAPVASTEACHELGGVADDVVCVRTPEPLHSVGRWYHDFSQTTDDEVQKLLAAVPRAEESGVATMSPSR